MDFLVICGGSGGGLIGNVPGITGTLLIDSKSENDIVINNLPVRPTNFERLDLDRTKDAQSGNSIFNYFLNHPGIISEPTAKNVIADLYKEYFFTTSFADGLSQSPTLGGCVIRHPENVKKLDAAINRLFIGCQMSADNPIDVWIVSSTAGGTGEGIHRFVAERFIKVLKEAPNPHKIHFIRIGPQTYRSSSTTDVVLNSFFGITLDNAFSENIKRKFGQNEINPARLTIEFIYVDLPDLGSGEVAKPPRRTLIASTCRALMMEEVKKAFNPIVTNMVAITRIGFWGGDFDDRKKFATMLRSLRTELSNLKKGNIPEVMDSNAPSPEFARNILESDDYKFGRDDILDKAWKLPQNFDKEPINLEELQTDIDKILKSFKAFFNDDENWQRDIQPSEKPTLWIHEYNKEQTENLEQRRFTIFSNEDKNISRYRRIRQAIIIKKWAIRKLGFALGDEKEEGEIISEGLVWEIYKIKREIIAIQKAFMKNKGQKAEEISDLINDLFIKSFEASLWINELKIADGELKKHKKSLEDLLNKIDNRLDSLGEEDQIDNGKYELIPAPLDKQMNVEGGTTWFDLLIESMNQEVTAGSDPFKNAVIRGANGLTEYGLRKLLRVDNNATIDSMKVKLRDDFGYYPAEKGQKEASANWWQGEPNPAIGNSFSTRIFPDVEQGLKDRLGDGIDDVDFLYTGTDAVGLNIISIEAGQLDGNYIDSFVFLIKNFIGPLQMQLKDWNFRYQQETGRFNILLKINLDEPMHKEFLKYIKLSDEEIKKIGVYSRILER